MKLNEKTDMDTLLGKNNNFDLKIQIEEKSEHRQEIENEIEMFHLESIYANHKQQVQEILYKQHIYSETYWKMMNEMLYGLSMSESEKNQFLFGYTFEDGEEWNKPLSKLMRDIMEEN